MKGKENKTCANKIFKNFKYITCTMNLLFPIFPVKTVGYCVLKPELSISMISAFVFNT